MTLHDILTAKLDALGKVKPGPLTLVETGTIRGTAENYAADDGWSTLTLAHYAAEHGGHLFSIDLDCSAAECVLSGAGGSAARQATTLITDYSIRALAKLVLLGIRPDFLLLDSANDAKLILHEFLVMAPALHSPAVVVVDDVVVGGDGIVKGHAVMPWFDEHGIRYTIEERNGAHYSTGVLSAWI